MAKVTLTKEWSLPHSDDWSIAHLSAKLIKNHQVALTGLNIKHTDDGWMIILKGVRAGQPVVHFSGAQTWMDTIEVLTYEVDHGALTWKPDRYAKI